MFLKFIASARWFQLNYINATDLVGWMLNSVKFFTFGRLIEERK